MEKLVFIAALLLLAGLSFGQVLPKGTLIGTHIMTINLNTGVSLEEFIRFFTGKYLPEMNKVDPEWQMYLVKGVRGSINADSYGLIHVIKSEEARSRFINPDGSRTEFFKSEIEKLQPINDELSKFGSYTYQWTDWLVQ